MGVMGCMIKDGLESNKAVMKIQVIDPTIV